MQDRYGGSTTPRLTPFDANKHLSLLDWLNTLDNIDNENLSKLSFALLICGQIWRERNLVFRNGKAMPNRVFIVA